MAYIICIETSGNNCSIALGKDGKLISIRETDVPNSHSASSAIFIDEVLKEANITTKELAAVAVSEGPGSYTGLRIGVSLAKGLCYTLNIPLIAIPTLQSMAYEALNVVDEKNVLFAPMIDARRMEVYTAVYNNKTQLIDAVKPLVLDETTHHELLENNVVVYSGNGSIKWQTLTNHKNARFLNIFDNSSKNILPLAYVYYDEMKFANISYFEPQYLKLFKDIL